MTSAIYRTAPAEGADGDFPAGESARQPTAADLFSACLDMVSAMQSTALAGFAAAATSATGSGVTSADADREPRRDRAGESISQAPWSNGESRSWYRRPFDTPFGSYMHGSGMFVPGGMLEAVWRSQAELAVSLLAGSHGSAPYLGWGNTAWPAGLPAYADPFSHGWFSQQFWAQQSWAMIPSTAFGSMPGMAGWGPTLSDWRSNAEASRAAADIWSAAAGIGPMLAHSVLESAAAMLGATSQMPAESPKVTSRDAPRTIAASYRSTGGHAVATQIEVKDGSSALVALPLMIGLSMLTLAGALTGGTGVA